MIQGAFTWNPLLMRIQSPNSPKRIGSEFNAHRERSHVANWMRITRLFDFKKVYITLFLAFYDAFVASNVHYKAFSPPSALYLLASAHALNAIRFQSTFNPPPEVD